MSQDEPGISTAAVTSEEIKSTVKNDNLQSNPSHGTKINAKKSNDKSFDHHKKHHHKKRTGEQTFTFADVPPIPITAFGGPIYERNWIGTVLMTVMLFCNLGSIIWLWILSHITNHGGSDTTVIAGKRAMVCFLIIMSIIYLATLMPIFRLLRNPENVFEDEGRTRKTVRSLMILNGLVLVICALISFFTPFREDLKELFLVTFLVMMGAGLLQWALVTGSGYTRGWINWISSPFRPTTPPTASSLV